MNLVIGGAYQGKLTWAVAQYGWKQEELLDLAKGRAPGGTVLVSPGGVDLAEAPGRGRALRRCWSVWSRFCQRW